ncbi:MAG: hypothetical protein KJO79_03015 [Verrucomicrobiae bacterium]|nr:hypothetical protein [Verrucomicrobiae bacterium]NNJ86126.1 hypothetical protein [Akkermansiaceae bacterium]
MFATEEFIAASRKFVCVRLESFESKQHQEMVRELLNGRFENTAFCILAPDGKTRLSRPGRSPQMGFGLGRGGDPDKNQATIQRMEQIAKDYPANTNYTGAVVPDFHSFKQALNIASGDQRLLVFTVAAKRYRDSLRKTIQKVANHPDAIGRYHYDFADTPDAQWSKKVDGDKNRTGIFIIRANEFGQDGKVVAELPLNSSAQKILRVLTKANSDFAATEKRKVYSEHIRKGRRQGIEYQDNLPWGEDRDADGKIDERRMQRPEKSGGDRRR